MRKKYLFIPAFPAIVFALFGCTDIKKTQDSAGILLLKNINTIVNNVDVNKPNDVLSAFGYPLDGVVQTGYGWEMRNNGKFVHVDIFDGKASIGIGLDSNICVREGDIVDVFGGNFVIEQEKIAFSCTDGCGGLANYLKLSKEWQDSDRNNYKKIKYYVEGNKYPRKSFSFTNIKSECASDAYIAID